MKKFKKFYLFPLNGYQYISRMLPASCRYYPSCSEYAKWQFEFNTPLRAFSATSLRILRCNQLFEGGIDYPLVNYMPKKVSSILIFMLPSSILLFSSPLGPLTVMYLPSVPTVTPSGISTSFSILICLFFYI